MIKKPYRNTALLFLTLITVNAFAQKEEAAVRQAVNRLFEGMKKSDTAMMRSAFTSQPIIQTIVNIHDKTFVETTMLDSLLFFMSLPHTEVFDERIKFDVVKIDGDLAMIWASYKFYVGKKFSHCGVDSFQLMKEGMKWKIIYLVDTRRKQKCEPI